MRTLILGDIIGRPGLRAVTSALATLQKQYRSDVVIANGENARDGYGIDAEIVEQLVAAGVDVITTGNHVWQDERVGELLDATPNLLRPDNYPGKAPGSGLFIHSGRGMSVAVINLQGRDRLPTIDCPFRRARDLVKRVRGTVDAIIVDFHAEATAEKQALAAYLDGDVTCVYGTHTHVATADERILPGGTAAITDIGACSPAGSVIGFDPTISIRRVLTSLPLRNEVLDERATIHGLVVESDGGRATSVERVTYESLV